VKLYKKPFPRGPAAVSDDKGQQTTGWLSWEGAWRTIRKPEDLP